MIDDPDVSMDETTETTMADFPVEILAEILDYCKSECLQLQNLRTVCKLWEFVINSLFEVCYAVNPHHWTALINTPGRFLHVKIDSSYPLNISSHQVAPFQIFTSEQFSSFCGRLQKLEFNHLDFNVTCLQMLQSARSLQELTLLRAKFPDWTSDSESGKVARLLGGSDQVSTWLPRLRKLRFRGDCCTDLLRIIASSVCNGKIFELRIYPCFTSEFVDDTEPMQKLLQEYIRDGTVTKCMVNNPAPFTEVVANIISCNKATLQEISIFGQFFSFNSNGTLQGCHFWLPFARDDPGSTPQTAINWMRVLCEKNHFSDLKLHMIDFREDALTAEEIVEVKQFELLISEVISRNRASFTKINIILDGKFKSDPEWATVKDGIFSRCPSLKHLRFKYYTGDIPEGETAENTITNVVFKGIETLPHSLTYFSIDFPISSTANNLQELDLKNLPNLETLILDCSFNNWFYFNEKNVFQFSGDDVRLLASKLPKLKYLILSMEKTPRSRRSLIHGAQRIAPDLRSFLQYESHYLQINLKPILSGNPINT